MMEEIKRSTLDYLVYKRLRELIATGVLKPGDQIIQEQIAKELKVSRTPIRKAIAQLEKDYLVVVENGKAYVRELTKEELITVFEIRSFLEGLVASFAAENVDIEWLTNIESRYKKAFEEHDYEEYKSVDIEFHRGLINLAKNPILSTISGNFWDLSVPLFRGILRDASETIHEHLAIIDALKKRDGKLARKLMSEHLMKTVRKLKKEIKKSKVGTNEKNT